MKSTRKSSTIINKEDAKKIYERTIFSTFYKDAGIPVDLNSIVSRDPPKPDIEFFVNGKSMFAELGQIVDKDLARSDTLSVKTGKSFATSYSNDDPLIYIFNEKDSKSYVTGGAPLILLAYYDIQSQCTSDSGLVHRLIGNKAHSMINSGKWKGIFVYDYREKEIIKIYGWDGKVAA